MSISDAANVIIALATVVSVIYIARQLSHTRKQAVGQFLFELDNQFRQYQKLHKALIANDGRDYVPPDIEEVWRYLGLFERCKVLIDSKTISIDVFDAFYGYRLYRVVDNAFIRETVRANYRDYRHFISLCDEVLRFRRRRGMDASDGAFEGHIVGFPRGR